MQIHELNNFNGTPGATNFLAIDDGSDTSRISGEALLDPVNSRIDNLTANVLPDSVETILDWADVESASKTLTKNVSGFDYLDLYFKEVTSGTNRIVFAQRYPRTAFPAQVTIPVISWGGGTDPKYLYFQDLMIAISGTTLTMSQLRIYSWDGKAADGASIEPGILVDQIRVDGVKISSNTSAELTDLRTAHNGTVYASARAAREADYNALEGEITPVANEVNNIRIGADGATYPSAGESVRMQVGKLNDATQNGYIQLSSGDFVRGVWRGGSIDTAEELRIASRTAYPVKKGDVIEIKTSNLQVAHGIYTEGATSSTDYRTWHFAPNGETYFVPVDGRLFVQCRKSNDSAISPSDYDATVKIYNTMSARQGKETEVNKSTIESTTGINVQYGYDYTALSYYYDNTLKFNAEKIGATLKITGTNTSGMGLRLKINGEFAVAIDGGQVASWSSGMTFKAGHDYVIKNTLVEGNISYTGVSQPTISIYEVGTSGSAGSLSLTDNGSKRFFTAQRGKQYNVVLYVNSGTTLTDVVYNIEIVDLTEAYAEKTKNKRVYTHSDYAIQQGGVFVNNTIYMFHSNSPTGITKVNVETGTETEYPFAFDHGNDMTYYNGKLYVCSMDTNGRIYIVNAQTMSVDSYVDFTINGTKTQNYGIAYDNVNNQFIIELMNGFAFADMNLTYKSQVAKSFTDAGTIQGIECDGYYIYLVESDPNEITVYDYSGKFVDLIKISTGDEPESLYNDKNGGWWLFTNVIGGGWYLDAVQIHRQLDLSNVTALIKTFSKI